MVQAILTLAIIMGTNLMPQLLETHQVMVEAIGELIMQSQVVVFSLPTLLVIIQPIVALVIHLPVLAMIFIQIIMMSMLYQ